MVCVEAGPLGFASRPPTWRYLCVVSKKKVGTAGVRRKPPTALTSYHWNTRPERYIGTSLLAHRYSGTSLGPWSTLSMRIFLFLLGLLVPTVYSDWALVHSASPVLLTEPKSNFHRVDNETSLLEWGTQSDALRAVP